MPGSNRHNNSANDLIADMVIALSNAKHMLKYGPANSEDEQALTQMISDLLLRASPFLHADKKESNG